MSLELRAFSCALRRFRRSVAKVGLQVEVAAKAEEQTSQLLRRETGADGKQEVAEKHYLKLQII